MFLWIRKVRFLYNRFRWLQTLYADSHLDGLLPGIMLTDGQGNRIGYLDELRLQQGRIVLRGWTLAQRIGIRLGETQIWRSPNEARDDVARAVGCDPNVGFHANLPLDDGPLILEIETPQGVRTIRHDLRIARSARRSRFMLWLRFWRETIPLLPMILRGILRKDADLPRRVKAALRLGPRDSELLLDPAFLSGDGKRPQNRRQPERITIIMPVYNAFELLPEALGRVLNHTDLPFRLILVEDVSPDSRVRPWLRDWIQSVGGLARVELVENTTNLGFIGSVNRAFDLVLSDPDPAPVVLLNSDAMVPAGWASRLVARLSDPMVATATPLSNDAEIFNAPVICVPSRLEPGQVDAIDAALRDAISSVGPEVAAPTGVGFCMALQYPWLARFGGFDPEFGRGYGEEVDWCRRTAARGARHVAVPDLFVEHRGGASFGSEKQALLRRNGAIISTRYPEYDQSVQSFIRKDPLVTPRLIAGLAWADSQSALPEVPVYIAHSLGGGAEKYLQDRISRDRVSVVLRLGGAFRFRIELDTPLGRVVANTDDAGVVIRIVSRLAKRRIVYSCAVGDPDLSELPGLLARLSDGAPLDVLMHDYLPLGPSHTLLDHDDVYRGVPAEDDPDPAHVYRCADGKTVPLRKWRDAWRPVLAGADRIVVFSHSSAEIVATAYPDAATRIVVTPHALLHPVPPVAAPDGDQIVVAVLGAIGPQKGAAVLSALSRTLLTEQKIGLVLIGRIAPGFPLAGGVPVHGAYALEDIGHLAAHYRVTHWLIPSVWPETFSYTVHECLATGLPVLAFDLGAQGDAVRLAANGVLLPWTAESHDAAKAAKVIIDALRKVPGTSAIRHAAEARNNQ